MALEAVVFPQDPFGHGSKDPYNIFGGSWSHDFGHEKQEEKHSFDFLETQQENILYDDWMNSLTCNSAMMEVPQILDELHQINVSNSSDQTNVNGSSCRASNSEQLVKRDSSSPSVTSNSARAKRRRNKSRKNQEEIENQRMTHIAVERNRRKQMNEYLAALRSLMPESYVQRGDQASIIGGAINFVKELEQQIHILSAHGLKKEKAEEGPPCLPFSEFFTFPQYSSTSSYQNESLVATNEAMATKNNDNSAKFAADIEVTMVECHANLKVRARQQPRQLLKMVSGLHNMRLTILHLYVTKVDQIVLYSICVKVEDNCNLASVDEIASAVYQMLGKIQEEAL